MKNEKLKMKNWGGEINNEKLKMKNFSPIRFQFL